MVQMATLGLHLFMSFALEVITHLVAGYSHRNSPSG
jgi:hypothetical protein